jgi:ferredoxin
VAAHIVTIPASGASFRVPDGMAVLLAAQRFPGGSPISVGCRGGGCGVCRIRVDEGTYTTRVMSRRHVTEEDQAAGIVLSCKVFPTSDLVITVLPPVEPSPATNPDNTNARLASASR